MGFEKVCGHCGRPFVAADVRRLYCDLCRALNRSANRARRATRAAHELRFVGVDGEGVDRPGGAHDYVMLSVGGRTLFRDGHRLSLGEILSFLWECHKEDVDATHVGFFLGYDFTQWFSQLPESTARLLLTNTGVASRKSEVKLGKSPIPDPVVWGSWEFDIMAGRRFKLRPHTHTRSQFAPECRNRTCRISMEHPRVTPDKPATKSGMGWFYLCDTGSFWQTSFLNVVKPSNWGGNAVATESEYALLEAGKAGRSRLVPYGDTSYYAEMVTYNTLENELLSRVTSRLNQGFMNDKIPIRLNRDEWFGPGRAAQKWMDNVHNLIADKQAIVKNRKHPNERANEYGILNRDIYMSVPPRFVTAAQASYYGGWFEIAMHGHIGTAYEYDINSAYPYIIASLPCLHTDNSHDARFESGTGNRYPRGEGRYTLLYGTFTGSNAFLGGLPFRTPTGSILRPHRTKGWYWAHEVHAARRAGLIDTLEIEEWQSVNRCTRCDPPFNDGRIGIERMYDLRLQMGKNTPAGKAFKLVYNSAYGKTAQSVGHPKYSNPIYASLITSGCRTLILDSIARHPMGPSGVAMVATDGVYFLERHPGLSLSKTVLGAWDETTREDMTLLMPGVYWDKPARESITAGLDVKMKSRGVSPRDLASQIERLDYEFAQAHTDLVKGRTYEWPEIKFPIRFQMVSGKLALHRNDWASSGRVEHNVTRTISANPESKRIPDAVLDHTLGVVRTGVYPQWASDATTPYHRSFGYLNQDLQHLDDYLDRDGHTVLSDMKELLHG